MTKTEQRLIAKYGTSTPEEIVRQKMAGIHVKDMPSVKSTGVDVASGECKRLCDAAGLEYLEGYEARIIEYTLSDERIDRDGDIIVQAGVNTEGYMKNPVCLLFHDSRSFPVGNCIKIWNDTIAKSTKGWMLFLDDRVDTSGMSERAFRYAKSRAMRAGSVGFRGTEIKFPTNEERRILGMKDWGVLFTACDLMEFSFCPVPSNAGAVSDALRKGALTPEDLKFIETEKPEDEVLDMKKEELEALIDQGVKKAFADSTDKAGKPISAANLKKMQDIADRMDAAHKTYKADHKACMSDLKSFLDANKPADTDDDGDTDANPTDGDKPKKAAEAEAKAAEDLEAAELATVLGATLEAVKK